MTLSYELKKTTIEDIKQISINLINGYARNNNEILTFLYNKGIIDDSSIERALEIAVFNQARQDYNLMTSEKKSYSTGAEHIGRPDCLVYALEKNIFSKKEIKKIPFDDENTAETYSQKHGKKNLLSVIRENLLNPKPSPKFEENHDPHPVCLCYH